MYIYIYIKRTSKYMVWIKGPGPHAIHTPRSIPPSSVIFHDSLLCFCYVILFLSPCSMVLLVCVCVCVGSHGTKGNSYSSTSRGWVLFGLPDL